MYACGENFTETVRVASGVTLYGALDCSNDWTYDAQKQTVLTAGAGAIPLTLASTATGADVFDFAVTAADNTAPGGSSIAVVVDKASGDVHAVRSDRREGERWERGDERGDAGDAGAWGAEGR